MPTGASRTSRTSADAVVARLRGRGLALHRGMRGMRPGVPCRARRCAGEVAAHARGGGWRSTTSRACCGAASAGGGEGTARAGWVRPGTAGAQAAFSWDRTLARSDQAEPPKADKPTVRRTVPSSARRPAMPPFSASMSASQSTHDPPTGMASEREPAACAAGVAEVEQQPRFVVPGAALTRRRRGWLPLARDPGASPAPAPATISADR